MPKNAGSLATIETNGIGCERVNLFVLHQLLLYYLSGASLLKYIYLLFWSTVYYLSGASLLKYILVVLVHREWH